MENEGVVDEVQEGEEVRNLFGDVLGFMKESNFDGSKEEYDVFKDVFCGDGGKSDNHLRGISGTMSSEIVAQMGALDLSDAGSSNSMENITREVCTQGACCIVESSGQKVLYSYYLCKSQEEENLSGNVDDGVLHGKGTDQQVLDNVVIEVHSGASPQSFCDGLLARDDCTASEATPGALVLMDQPQQEFDVLNWETFDDASKKAIIKDLPRRLQEQAHSLILDGSWKIEPIKRSDRLKLSWSYIPPDGLPFRALSQAWKVYGEKLLSDEPSSEQDEKGREWRDVDMFWRDLADTLLFTEKEASDAEKPLSLLHRWKILDPYMAVVCIDKRIGHLRQGKGVRVVRYSTTLVLHDNKNMTLADKGVDLVDGALTEPFPSFNASSNKSQSMLPDAEPTCYFEVTAKGSDHQTVDIPVGKNVQTRRSSRQVNMGPSSCDSSNQSMFPAVEPDCSSNVFEKANNLLTPSVPVVQKVQKRRTSRQVNRKLSPCNSLNRVMLPAFETDCDSNVYEKATEKQTCTVQVVEELQKRRTSQRLYTKPCSGDSSNQSVLPPFVPDSISNVFEKTTDQHTVGMQVVQKVQRKRSSRQTDRLSSSWGDVNKSSFKSLSRSTGKGLSSPSISRSISQTGSAFKGKRSNTLSSKSSFLQRISSSLVASPSDDFIPQESSRDGPSFPREAYIGHQMQVPDPKEKILYDKGVDGLIPDANEGVSLPLKLQCAAKQRLIKESGLGQIFVHNSDWDDQDFSSDPQVGTSIDEKLGGTSELKPELEQTSTEKSVSSSSKKRKKSKRISEIGAVDSNGKCKKSKFKDGESREVSDPFDIQFPEEADNKLMCLSRPEHPVPIEPTKHKDDIVKASKAVQEQSSVIDEASLMTKKPHESALEAGNQSGKDKSNFNLLSEDEPGGTLLNEEKSQVDQPVYKSPRRKLSQQNKRPRPKKVPRHQMDIKESTVVVDAVKTDMDSHSEGSNKELIPHFSSSPEAQSSQKVTKSEKIDAPKRKKPRTCHIQDDDLLVSFLFKRKKFNSRSKLLTSKTRLSLSEALRKLKSKRGSCKLLFRIPEKGIKHSKDVRRFDLGTKNMLCWLIEMGSLSLKDVVQFRSPKNSEVLKVGWITREGILCNCCSDILSVTEFTSHAGFKTQKSSLNIFLKSGKPYTLCQIEAWSEEYKARKGSVQIQETEASDDSDDICGVCGDGGDLICCDNCPSTYHQQCLPSQELPEGSWYCSYCICKICRDVVHQCEASSSLAALVCSQCEHKYHATCIKEKVTCTGDLGPGTWCCGESCQEVYLGLRSRVGVLNRIGDGFSWAILRCSHDEQKLHSAKKVAAMAECNIKLAIALTIMEKCFKPMVDTRTGIDMIPHVLYNWRSNFARLNYQGFYIVVLEKGDELVSVAAIRLHGVTVAEMPLIATCTEHRRQGMCRRLMNVIEKMLRSLKVKMMVLSAISDLVGTWTSVFGFKPLDPEDLQLLKNVNLMSFPETSLLKKNLCEVRAQEPSPQYRSSPSTEERDNQLSLKEYQPQTSGVCGDNCILESGKMVAENARSDMDEESLLQVRINVPVELFDCEESSMLLNSWNSAVTDRHNEHQDSNDTESYNEHMKTLNNPGRDNELPDVPSATLTITATRKMEEDLSQKFSVVTEETGVGVLSRERRVDSQGDEIVETGTSEPKAKTDGFFSDEGTADSPFCVVSDINNNILEELNLSKVLVDKSTISKDEVCDSVILHSVAKGFTSGKVEA